MAPTRLSSNPQRVHACTPCVVYVRACACAPELVCMQVRACAPELVCVQVRVFFMRSISSMLTTRTSLSWLASFSTLLSPLPHTTHSPHLITL